MKPRLAIIQRAILLLLLALPGALQAQFTFTTNNGTITITAYTGPGGDVTIPGTTNGLPVTSIGTNAFENFTSSSVTSVTVPDSVTNIGDRAFENCQNMTNFMLGGGVISIGGYAFLS